MFYIASHFFAGQTFAGVVFDVFFICRVRQVVVLYSNACIGIGLSGLSIGRFRQVVDL